MKTSKLLPLLCLSVCGIHNKGFSQSTGTVKHVPVAAQWHFSGNNAADPSFEINEPSSIGGVDWVYSVLPTEKKQYMCVGYTSGRNSKINPVIFKLDKYGNILWIHHITQASGSGLDYNGSEFGYLTQVIKTPNGYAATGAAYISGSASRAAILLEVDEDGNYLHGPSLFLSGAETRSFGRSLAIDEDAGSNHSIYIAGNCLTNTSPTAYWKAFVYKIDYVTWTMGPSTELGAAYTTSLPVDGNGGNMFFKIRTKQTSSNTHEIFACGYKSGSADDNVVHSITTVDPFNASISNPGEVIVKDKDMWLVNLSSSLSVGYEKTFVKSDINYPSSIVYTETGPFSARGIETSTTGLAAGTLATSYLKASVNNDERAYDFTFTSDGKIAMVGLVNQVAPLGYLDGNGYRAVQSVPFNNNGVIEYHGGFVDPVRNYYYDEYMDGDGYLLKIDPATGDLIYSKNVSHYCSKDFYPQVIQNGRGNFVISGSSADYNPTDYEQPEEYDALLLETPDAPNTTGSPDHLWRRGYHTEDKEEGMCTFTLAQTADGGFVLGGDNDNDHDNFSITKFAPYCSPNEKNYAIDKRESDNGIYRVPPGSITWPDNVVVKDGDNIAAEVLVPKGTVLTIKDCHLHFASSDHMYDFWDMANDPKAIGRMMGIVVEPGGKLIISNSELSGMDDCMSGKGADRYMWDGIVIKGINKEDQNASHQGSLVMDKAVIRDARIGTMMDEAHRDVSEYSISQPATMPEYNAVTSSSRYNAIGTGGGGIVTATDSRFQDCRFSVSFQQYLTPGSAANSFEKCTFEATKDGMGDPIFYADPDGKRQPSSTFFSAWDVQNLKITGCDFRCDESFPVTQWPVGIIDADAGFTIQSSGFANLSTGIQGSFGAGITRLLDIEKNQFSNTGNGVNVANSMNNMTIKENIFNVPGSEITGHPGGVLIQNCTGYNISQNTFLGMSKPTVYPTYPPSSRGIQVSFGSSWTNYNNLIHNNVFNNLRHPAIALQINSDQTGYSGLVWKCNDFLSDNSRSIGMLSGVAGGSYVPATMRIFQGIFVPGIMNYPAENRFYTTCNNGNSPVSRERLYADGMVTQTVLYSYDGSAPEYDPGTGCSSSIYALNNTYPAVDQSTYCDPANMEKDPEAHKLARINDELNSAEPYSDRYHYLIGERDLLINASVRDYARNGDNKSAGALLERYGRYAEALPFYVSDRNWTAANETWEKLPKESTDEQQYAALTRLTIDLYSAGKSWKDMDNEQRSMITEMATLNTYPGYMAAAVADRLDIRKFVWPYAVEAEGEAAASAAPARKVVPGDINAGNSIQLFPNPTNGNLTLQSKDAGWLSIYNMQGALITTYSIADEKTTLTIPATVAAGTYVARFISVSGNVQQTKITVNR
ncbi:right-handed parallel beta-helix repeat-containing protein [Chitinophagaceae bacterium MMS25-I14]